MAGVSPVYFVLSSFIIYHIMFDIAMKNPYNIIEYLSESFLPFGMGFRTGESNG
jgi:hypothetical protein